MKKLLLHIILISYAALLFKPVMPYVNDFVGHVFFYAKHLATVHEENGHFHVHLEAAKNSSEENNNKSDTPSPSKKDNSITAHCLFLVTDKPVFGNSAHCNYVPVKNDAAISGSIEKNYPPPRC